MTIKVEQCFYIYDKEQKEHRYYIKLGSENVVVGSVVCDKKLNRCKKKLLKQVENDLKFIVEMEMKDFLNDLLKGEIR